MQDNSITSLREMMEQLPTEQLDQMLQEELEKEKPDGNAVRMILQVLREREKDMPVEITPGIQKAWEKYQRNIANPEVQSGRKKRVRTWFIRIGSVAAMLCILLLAIPGEAEAESLFDKLTSLTDSIVEFFSPGQANDNPEEYQFKTDHPGLQQVYDAVVALGVKEPVVPSWLPEGYALAECKTVNTSKKTSLVVNFAKESDFAILSYDIYNLDVSHEYHWDGEDIRTYERRGQKYTIMLNNDRWVVIWFTEKTECFLTLDCSEDVVYKILDSIYVTEDE